MSLKPKLLEMLRSARDEQVAFVSNLSDAERARAGTLECWSAKDIVAHNAEWDARMAQSLSPGADTPPPAGDEDVNRLNDEMFEVHAAEPWTAVLDLADRAFGSLYQRVALMDDEELQAPVRMTSQDERPAWRGIAGNGYSHPLIHLAQCYLESGDLARSALLEETMMQAMSELDDSPSWQGTVIYNMACYHAIAGQAERAIAGLRRALQLNPDLTAWSKEDPDFESVRNRPDYLAIYS